MTLTLPAHAPGPSLSRKAGEGLKKPVPYRPLSRTAGEGGAHGAAVGG